MGIFLTKFKSYKPYSQVLEELEKQISSLENYRKKLYTRHQNIVERFLASSLVTYIVIILIFYNFFYPNSVKCKVLSYILIIVSPILIAITKKIITWFFRVKLMRTKDHIEILENEKIKILDAVIKTETYSEAKKLFDKYAPRYTKKLGFPIKLESSEKIIPKICPVSENTSTLVVAGPSDDNNTDGISTKSSRPPQRYVFDQLIDYLQGDGPSNRYALICKNCARHNGMALKEDFPYISFRCCYCYCLNPSKKNRLLTTDLEYFHSTDEKHVGGLQEEKAKETEILYSKYDGFKDISESECKLASTHDYK